MPNCVEDLQMLRLTKAFQKLTDPDARRGVLFYVEEQVEKQREKVSSTRGTLPLAGQQILAGRLEPYIGPALVKLKPAALDREHDPGQELAAAGLELVEEWRVFESGTSGNQRRFAAERPDQSRLMVTAAQCKEFAEQYKRRSQADGISTDREFILKNISRSFACDFKSDQSAP